MFCSLAVLAWDIWSTFNVGKYKSTRFLSCYAFTATSTPKLSNMFWQLWESGIQIFVSLLNQFKVLRIAVILLILWTGFQRTWAINVDQIRWPDRITKKLYYVIQGDPSSKEKLWKIQLTVCQQLSRSPCEQQPFHQTQPDTVWSSQLAHW